MGRQSDSQQFAFEGPIHDMSSSLEYSRSSSNNGKYLDYVEIIKMLYYTLFLCCFCFLSGVPAW